MIIREAQHQDLAQLLSLYAYLHDNDIPAMNAGIGEIWDSIINDPNHHIVVCAGDDTVVSSCVVVIVPNLTHAQRPYAFIENVITHPNYRKKGYASQVLDYAKGIAAKHNCYKIMLMTSSREEATLNFYKRAGYNMMDKTAFIQWLD